MVRCGCMAKHLWAGSGLGTEDRERVFYAAGVCAGVHRSVFGGGRVMGKKRGTSIMAYRVGGWGGINQQPKKKKILQIL